MTRLLIEGSGWEWVILLMIFIFIAVPIILLIVGLVTLRKKQKRGKILLIAATVYSIISLGICGGLGF